MKLFEEPTTANEAGAGEVAQPLEARITTQNTRKGSRCSLSQLLELLQGVRAHPQGHRAREPCPARRVLPGHLHPRDPPLEATTRMRRRGNERKQSIELCPLELTVSRPAGATN